MKHDSLAARELIARAIILQDEHLLINQSAHPQTGHCYYALPGGHVEAGESCAVALRRELREELAADCAVGDLQFVIEQTYAGRHQNDVPRHELVLYFSANLLTPLSASSDNQHIFSPEADKHFRWLPISEISGAPFLPSQVASHLQKYFSGQSFSAYVFQDNITAKSR